MRLSIFAAFVICGSFSSVATAEVGTGTTVDMGMADITLANLDAFSAVRSSAAIMPLVSRYQLQAGIHGYGTDALNWHANGAVIDSSTGPIALGAMGQYSTGLAELEGSALPGWRLPEEDLQREFADVVAGGGGAVSFANRHYALGVNVLYFGRTYIIKDNSSSNPLLFWQEDFELERIHQIEVSSSFATKMADKFVMVTGLRDFFALDQGQKPYVAARFGAVDNPNIGLYENYGGLEIDMEGLFQSGSGLGMHYIGVAGDVRISQVFLRSGYRYDFVEESHIPAFGMGLDDGKISIDYGVQLQITEDILQQHAIGLRFRL